MSHRDPDGPFRAENVPKSLMLKTPGTLELALRFASFEASLGGLLERPWTAESTLLRGAVDAILILWERSVSECSVYPTSDRKVRRELIIGSSAREA